MLSCKKVLQKLHQVRIKNKGTRYFQRYVSLLLTFNSGSENHFLDLLPRLLACLLPLYAFLYGREEGKAPSAVQVWDEELPCLEQCIIFPKAFMWHR